MTKVIIQRDEPKAVIGIIRYIFVEEEEENNVFKTDRTV